MRSCKGGDNEKNRIRDCNTALCCCDFSLLIRNGIARCWNWGCRIDFFNHRIYGTPVKELLTYPGIYQNVKLEFTEGTLYDG